MEMTILIALYTKEQWRALTVVIHGVVDKVACLSKETRLHLLLLEFSSQVKEDIKVMLCDQCDLELFIWCVIYGFIVSVFIVS